MTPRGTGCLHKQQLAAGSLAAEPRTLRASSNFAILSSSPTTSAGPKLELTPTPKTRITLPCPTPSPGHPRRNRNLLMLVIRMIYICIQSAAAAAAAAALCVAILLPLLLFVIAHLPPEVVLHKNRSSSAYCCHSFPSLTKILL